MKFFTVIEQEVNKNGQDNISIIKSFKNIDDVNNFIEGLYNELYGKCNNIKLLHFDYLFCETLYRIIYYRIIENNILI